jgi:hypothetical protein
MFFLEIGKPNSHGKTRNGIERVHGDWHFLFELCNWYFRTSDGICISSEDAPGVIDDVFASLELGLVQAAVFNEDTEDLSITFTPGVSLHVSPDEIYAEPDDTEWIFFIPEELAWDKKKTAPTLASIHTTSQSI